MKSPSFGLDIKKSNDRPAELELKRTNSYDKRTDDNDGKPNSTLIHEDLEKKIALIRKSSSDREAGEEISPISPTKLNRSGKTFEDAQLRKS